ncbi:MAG: ATP-dependent nuclease [Halarcobacter ebronensis]|uniref:ATP-dependent nuclease n=1 Tax=Halarcobacter ebronensis TaxID=1462615 RepID=UPI003C7474EB
MYLKSLKIENFRKFGTENNVIEFVDSKNSLQSDEIDIASASTLIVGKNNSGKTTITKALLKIVKEKSFKSSDFNFNYLNKLLEEYKENSFSNKPYLYFEVKIGIDKNNNDDLVTNFIPFINIENIQQTDDEKEFTIKVRYELKEAQDFENRIKELIESINSDDLFRRFIAFVEKNEFEFNFYNLDDEKVDKLKFKIENLIDIETINANKIIDDRSLSKTFSKIIKYRYESQEHDLEEKIDVINKDITEQVKEFNGETVNEVLHEIEDSKRFEVSLSANLTFEKLMQNLIKYEYLEEELYIPEGQFGLGYANLMSIIGQIIEYIEKYPSDQEHSKLNLICIEEPEAFMHPQMQELFIRNINKAITKLLSGADKKINSQLIITTHSSHILNSKIHESNSFNNINYIITEGSFSTVVNLQDSIIIDSNSEKKEEELKFIKKHIKFKVSELFFADAIIFVEGITEETFLSYYLSIDSDLNKKYITVFNINGAHGLVYHNLIKLLKIPTIIITDLDIKRTDPEKNNFEQINSLDLRETTNQTIIKYNQLGEDISQIPNRLGTDIYITYQNQAINGFFATSLEESFILKNFDNDILNKVLKDLKPQIYAQIVGDPEDRNKLKDNSYKLQSKLSKSKSEFANTFLYELCNSDVSMLPSLPNYIDESLRWLKVQLNIVSNGE